MALHSAMLEQIARFIKKASNKELNAGNYDDCIAQYINLCVAYNNTADLKLLAYALFSYKQTHEFYDEKDICFYLRAFEIIYHDLIWNKDLYQSALHIKVSQMAELLRLAISKWRATKIDRPPAEFENPSNDRVVWGGGDKDLDPERYVFISHGGCYPYIQDFLAGEETGYRLERGGVGLQVHPVEIKEEGNTYND